MDFSAVPPFDTELCKVGTRCARQTHNQWVNCGVCGHFV